MARLRITPAQAWRDFLHVGVAPPLGIFWLIALGLGLALGVGLAVLTVGIPILAVTLLLWKAGANLERRRAALVLGRPMPACRRPRSRRARPPRRLGGEVGFVSVALYSAAVAALVAPPAGDVRAGAIRTDPDSRRSLELRSSAGDVTAEVQTRR